MMQQNKPNIVVTGISGDLGLKLLSQLGGYRVTGIDLKPPQTSLPLTFVPLDLGLEESCRDFFLMMRALRPVAIIHLAFVADPVRSGTRGADRMWQINVGGTARVFEALTEINRDEEIVKKFIYLSCAFAYGSGHSKTVSEDQKLEASGLSIAIHKMEADNAIQQRAPSARGCSVYLLRPSMFAGKGSSNYLLEVFQGTPRGKGKLGAALAKKGNLVPHILPWGKKYIEQSLQFVHTEDVARLIAYILGKTEPESKKLTVLNVSGRGEPISTQLCTQIARTKLMRVPGRWMMRSLMQVLWNTGISAVPPEAAPHLIQTPIMSTERLRQFLGEDYGGVIRHTTTEAFSDGFVQHSTERTESAVAASTTSS